MKKIKPSTEGAAKMKFSEAIRRGSSMVKPIRGDFFFDGRCCAVGTALVAHYGSYKRADQNKWAEAPLGGILESVNRLFGVPMETVKEASDRFEQGHSRVQVASWLREIGY